MPIGSIPNAYNGTGPEAMVLYVSIIFIILRVIFHLQEISNRFKRKSLRRGQPLYKEQLACPKCVLLFGGFTVVSSTQWSNH